MGRLRAVERVADPTPFALPLCSTLYIVMEFCQGGDLGEVIKQCRRKK
jgi:serine/threonine protein kinase